MRKSILNMKKNTIIIGGLLISLVMPFQVRACDDACMVQVRVIQQQIAVLERMIELLERIDRLNGEKNIIVEVREATKIESSVIESKPIIQPTIEKDYSSAGIVL